MRSNRLPRRAASAGRWVALCLFGLIAACHSAAFDPYVQTPFGLNWGLRYQDMIKRDEIDVSAAPSGTMQGKLLVLPAKPKGMPDLELPQALFTDAQGLVALIFAREYGSAAASREDYTKIQQVMTRYYGPPGSATDLHSEWRMAHATVMLDRLQPQTPKPYLRLVLTGPDYAAAQRIIQRYEHSRDEPDIQIR